MGQVKEAHRPRRAREDGLGRHRLRLERAGRGGGLYLGRRTRARGLGEVARHAREGERLKQRTLSTSIFSAVAS